jgi:hypothetical protein
VFQVVAECGSRAATRESEQCVHGDDSRPFFSIAGPMQLPFR